ncbi:poly(glycerol-phosphate) alpha-glucosyltransferase [Arcanobacterium wilhelmae]|uniref:Poly(Glycerol-phosphate) alpha-glucosyltransferase n=1 Tax=Arcanobacterium wilhelmae TaxID=1803177 RepID=A0ABT9NBY8_9ACTO|nr:glycosyltransferase family 4 protein [Arcanobacterium wilhelmae]MDP9801229.1 poly(glycerol-phosphate) alpha-glucosyltransferase [Arcanobacterium wilhelmae]
MAIVQLMDSVGYGRGGLTRVMYQRLEVLKEYTDEEIWVVITGLQFDACSVFSSLQRDGFIPEGVKVHALFDDDYVGYSIRGRDPEFSFDPGDGALVAEEKEGLVRRYYDISGKFLGLTKYRKNGTRISSDIHSHESPQLCLKTVEYDALSRPRRAVYRDSEWNEKFETVLTTRGELLYSAWKTVSNYSYRCTLFNNDTGKAQLFSGFHEMRAWMLREFLRGLPGEVTVISDEPATVPMITLMPDSNGINGIGMIHNTHFVGDGSGDSKNQLRGWAKYYSEPRGALQKIACLTNAQLGDLRSLYPAWTDRNSRAITNMVDIRDVKARHDFFYEVLFVGRLAPVKGVGTLILGVEKALETLPNLKFNIVGGGPEDSSLRAMVEQRGLGDSVIFRGWDEDVYSWYDRSDCLLANSEFEGVPLTMLESFSSGIPIITRPTLYGPVEIVDDGVNGFITDGTPEGIADKICSLYSDVSEFSRLSQAAIDASHRFSPKVWRNKWLSLIALDVTDDNEASAQ